MKPKKRKLKAAQGLANKPDQRVHDRRTKDALRNANLAAVEVDDPYAQEPGGKIMVMRSVRDDPLAAMYAAGTVDLCQFEAGRRWQGANAALEVGIIKAIDPSKEAVDGGRMADPVCEGVVRRDRARKDIERAETALGEEGLMLVRDILESELTIAMAATRRGLKSETGRKYLGKRFRECLKTLAFVFGFSTTPTYKDKEDAA